MHQCCPPGLTTNQHPGGGVGGKRDARWTTNSPPLNPQSTPNPPPIHPQSTPNSPPRGDLVVDWWCIVWIRLRLVVYFPRVWCALLHVDKLWWFVARELDHQLTTTESPIQPRFSPQGNFVTSCGLSQESSFTHRGTLSRSVARPRSQVSPTGEPRPDSQAAQRPKPHPHRTTAHTR